MIPLLMLALFYVVASFPFSIVVVFFNEELKHNEDAKRELIRVDTNHCNQCLCSLEENPILSVNNS